MKKSPNLLLLDEPTNHLDIIGKESLEDLLTQYDGSLLFVSHDRYFINKVADSLLIFEKDKIVFFRGKYEEYLKSRSSEKTIIEKSSNRKVNSSPNAKKNTSLIRKVEKEIEQKEKKKKEIESMMLDENVYNDYKKMNELQLVLKSLEDELDEKLLEWENLCS